MDATKHPRFSFQVLALVLVILLEYETRLLAAEVITCDVPSVRRGEPTNITCHFKEDVSVNKKNIKVLRLLPGSESIAPVMDCYWLSAAEFKCNNAEGYQLDGPLGMTVTVGIANAVEDFEGTYMCEVVPSDPSDIQPCSLKLQDNIGSLTVFIPAQSQDNMAVISRIDAAIGLSAVVLIILVAIMLIFIFRKQLWKWWLQYCKCWPRQAEEKPDPEKQEADKKEEIEQCVRSVLENMKNNGVISEILKTEIEREVARHDRSFTPPKRPPPVIPAVHYATESSFKPREREIDVGDFAEESRPMLHPWRVEFSTHPDNEPEVQFSKKDKKKKEEEEKKERKRKDKEEAAERKKREKEEKKRKHDEDKERKKQEKERKKN